MPTNKYVIIDADRIADVTQLFADLAALRREVAEIAERLRSGNGCRAVRHTEEYEPGCCDDEG